MLNRDVELPPHLKSLGTDVAEMKMWNCHPSGMGPGSAEAA